MNSPERLAGDQRAVLQLILGQGRSYAEIAGMLSIAPDEVGARARAALDALGPPTTLSDAERGGIADYLLGQLAASDAGAVSDALADSPGQRAWARVVSSELGPLAADPLPRIPDGRAARVPPPAPDTHPTDPHPTDPHPDARNHDDDTGAAPQPEPPADQPAGPRSSRTGGIVLLSVLTAAIIAAIVIFVVKPGGSSHKHPGRSDAVAAVSQKQTNTSASSSSQTTSASASASIVGQIQLTPPSGGGQVTGTAFVARQGSLRGLAIEAKHVPPTTTKPRTAYAAWLYNSPGDAVRLGYFSKGVSKSGDLGSTAELPANAARYRLLIITLQTGDTTAKTPGPVVLEGKLSQVSKSKL